MTLQAPIVIADQLYTLGRSRQANTQVIRADHVISFGPRQLPQPVAGRHASRHLGAVGSRWRQADRQLRAARRGFEDLGDRGGHPTINPFINPNEVKDVYHAGQPADDVANYLEPWTKLLQGSGGYSAAEATAAARSVLPDILSYGRAQPVAYPNGRTLADDVFSARMAFLTNGKVRAGGVGPYEDLLAEFPFLGLPNPLPE